MEPHDVELPSCDNAQDAPQVVLEVMPHQVWVRHPSEDWTGVTNVPERRKLQNRLQQRAYRRRKKLLAQGISSESNASSEPAPFGGPPWGTMDASDEDIGYLIFALPVNRIRAQRIAQRAYEAYTLRAPRPAHLQHLIRLNVLNGIARNATLLGLPVDSLCQDDLISPISHVGPHEAGALSSNGYSLCPESLRPTRLQYEVPHHPWIDLLPFPQMRDNFLMTFQQGIFEEDDLCIDLLSVAEDGGDIEKASLIVWGDPWDPRCWEATLSFWSRWGWLMRGCTEVFDATNRWRQIRGEKTLDFSRLLGDL